MFGNPQPIQEADGTSTIVVANQDTVYTQSLCIRSAEFFGIWLKAANSPDLKVEVEMGYKLPTTEGAADSDWAVPDEVGDIYSNITSTSAFIRPVYPVPMPFIRFKITGNAGNSANATIQGNIFIQQHP